MQSATQRAESKLARAIARLAYHSPWWLLLVPLFLLGPIVFSGELFLPQVPQIGEPLRSENPLAAEAGQAALRYTSSDRLYPALTDQYAMAEAVRAGGLPTWEPNLGLGIPLFAQSIAGPTYPPNWLTFLVTPERLAGPLAALSLVLAGLGAWLFLRRRGLTRNACLLGAVAYQLGGWGVANLYLFMKVDAALYLPWCLWALEGLARRKPFSGAWLSLGLGLSLLAGFLPIGVFVCAASALYALARLTPLADHCFDLTEEAPAEGAPGTQVSPLLRALLFGCLGIGASALAMWPLIEVSGQSERQEQSVSKLTSQALPSSSLMGVPLLDLFGTPSEATPGDALPVVWWLTPKSESEAAINANPLEWNTYAGAAVLLLALVGVIAAPRRAAMPAGLLLVVLGFAMAWPPMRWLYALPGLDAGAPMRSLSLAWFLWPWLAAIGLDAIERRRKRALISLAVLSVLLVFCSALLWLQTDPGPWSDWLERSMMATHDIPLEEVHARLSRESSLAAALRLRSSAILCGAMGLMLLWCATWPLLRPGKRALPICAWMLLACVIAEGMVAAREHISGQSVAGDLFPASKSIEAIRQAAGEGRVLRYDPIGVGDVVNLARPNMLQPYGIADLTPWVVFPPKSHNDLFAAYDPEARYQQGFARLSDTALLDNPILDLFCVSAILSKNPIQHERLEPLLERPGFHVYHRKGAFGRARLVARAEIAKSDAAAPSQLASPGHDVRASTLLSASYASRQSELVQPAQDPGRLVKFQRPSKSSVSLRVEGAQGGYLVLHEQHYPGWTATLNGQSAEILRADHAFQAIRLQPGLNQIEFNYSPASVRYGLIISAASLLLAALIACKLGA